MKKFIKKIILFIILNLLIILSLVVIILKIIPPQFSDLYQSEIGNKINRLKSIKEQKIIYVTGSSGAFCIDSKKISEKLNIEFVNLGLHAGFGQHFINEIAKDGIKQNDIVILSHEFDTYYNNYEEPIGGIALLATSINDNLSYLKYFSEYEKKEFLKYLPGYIFTKLDKLLINRADEIGVYSSSAFNEYGDIDVEVLHNEENPYYHKVNDYTERFNESTMDALKDFVKHARKKGANVVFNFPLMRIAYNYPVDYNQIKKTEKAILNILDLESLYPMKKSLKTEEYFYDTANHCNTWGKNEYTQYLIDNLKKYMKEQQI